MRAPPPVWQGVRGLARSHCRQCRYPHQPSGGHRRKRFDPPMTSRPRAFRRSPVPCPTRHFGDSGGGGGPRPRILGVGVHRQRVHPAAQLLVHRLETPCGCCATRGLPVKAPETTTTLKWVSEPGRHVVLPALVHHLRDGIGASAPVSFSRSRCSMTIAASHPSLRDPARIRDRPPRGNLAADCVRAAAEDFNGLGVISCARGARPHRQRPIRERPMPPAEFPVRTSSDRRCLREVSSTVTATGADPSRSPTARPRRRR